MPSQGDFWGGYMMDSWLYKVLALFPITGLLGIDQLALRSPLTAFLKLLVNIFFWGAWYIYDILQITMDSTFVAKYGMSTPYGQRGHGYKFFKDLTDTNLDEFTNASGYNGGVLGTFLFIAYFFLSIFLGFTGIPNMILGDFNGGIIKLFSNMTVLPFFFYIIGSFVEIFSVATLGKDNIPHTWPLYPFFTRYENYPAINLIGEEERKKKLAEHMMKYEKVAAPPPTTDPAKKVLTGGRASIPSTEDAPLPQPEVLERPLLMDFAIKAAESVGIAISNYPPIAAFNTISAAKDGVQAASNIAKSAATALEKKLSDPATADKLIDKVLGVDSNPVQMNQTGGGHSESSGQDTILFGGMLLLVVGGFAAAFFRKITLPKRKDDSEYPRKTYERNDAPPLPGGI